MSDTSMIFNKSLTAQEYGAQPLFFGKSPGLFDTIHKQYPTIWALYKEMKSLDWDENEFDYTTCLKDFETCDPVVAWMMIRTLAWQWEQDSVAARSVAPVLASFITAPELWAAYQRVSDNELVHAATYSEIVRMSFVDPKKVLTEILEVGESLQRMDTVSRVLADLYEASHDWANRRIPYSQELYNKVYVGIATIFAMERIQFMASFAITFTICGMNLFQSIGTAVQKIAQDELEVHVQLAKEVLRIENETERGRIAAEQTRDTMTKVIDEIITSEMAWLDYMFADSRSLPGTNRDRCGDWVLFNAKDPVATLGISLPQYKFPDKNPMPHLEPWLNMNKTQRAPQEQDLAQYKVGVSVDDLGNEEIEVDF